MWKNNHYAELNLFCFMVNYVASFSFSTPYQGCIAVKTRVRMV